MRYAIISDIHSNLHALKAVLTDISAIGADEIICLGDTVGYGPSPKPVLEKLEGRVGHSVLGNHDAAVSGMMSTASFNDDARRLVEWTAFQLERQTIDKFRHLPLMVKLSGFVCAHGEFRNPARFGYVLDSQEAEDSLAARTENLLFVGHSHVPGVYVSPRTGGSGWIEPADFSVGKGARYIVNVGSVGCPRDNDIRASYCLYDLESGAVLFRKVPFDMDFFRKDLRAAGIQEKIFVFLGGHGDAGVKRTDSVPLSCDEARRVAASAGRLAAEVAKLRRSRSNLTLVCAALGIASVSLGVLYLCRDGKTEKVPSAIQIGPDSIAGKQEIPVPGGSHIPALEIRATGPAISVRHVEPGRSVIGFPEGDRIIDAARPAEQFSFSLGKGASQSVSFFKDKDGIPVLSLKSGDSSAISAETVDLVFPAGSQVSMSAQIMRIGASEGIMRFSIVQVLKDGSERELRSDTKTVKAADRWTLAAISIPEKESPAAGTVLRFRMAADFKGEFQVRKFSVTVK